MSRERLRRVVEETDTPAGKAFDLAVIIAILASVVLMSIDTLPNLSDAQRAWIGRGEQVLLLLFAAEYVLRLVVAQRPLGYAGSVFGIVDLVAILPALVGATIDTRAVRALRLLRIARILKLARYNAAVRRLHLALRLAWEEIVLFMAASLVLLFIASFGIYQFERDAQPEEFGSVFHAMWWAIVTLTTVGYGDVVPITTGGKIFTFIVLVVGLGVVAMPAGLVASALTRAREIESEGRRPE